MTRAGRAAAWIAEAIFTGNALAHLPPEIAPRGRAEGERVALLALEVLGIAPCGIRTLGGVAGPMLEGRLLAEGLPVAALRHPAATAALVGVLAEALEPGGEDPPRLSALHPALDIADSRFTAPPGTVPLRAADLAGLGMVVVGAASPAGIGDTGALRGAAAAARRLGGLPAGALLVAAGLSAPITPDGEGRLTADLGPFGTVSARLA